MRRVIADDTIVAVSTPMGEGGIAIVRMSGGGALEIADTIFCSRDGKKPSGFGTYTVHYGHVVNRPKTKDYSLKTEKLKTDAVDEVLLTVMRAPKTYTREDVVEINCHGGIQAAKKVLALVTRCGARIASPGEFTKRAFLNGRLDLTQAEAVLDIIRAKTEGSLRMAMSQLEGGLSKDVRGIRESALDIAAQLEASIDFPEEEPETEKREEIVQRTDHILIGMKKLIDTYDDGMLLKEGFLAIICGRPNVGKSSLMNLLLKRDRVIVSPVPGTTRDTVEEMINLKGIPIRLVDTAGIAEARDIVEKEGMRRAKQYLRTADLVILMLDNSVGLGREDMDIIELVKNRKKIVVINKCDLEKKVDPQKVSSVLADEKVVEISVTEKRNIDILEDSVVGMVSRSSLSGSEAAIVSSARHKQLLDRALENMISVKKSLAEGLSEELVMVDLKEAINDLGLIVGESVSEDILDRIFDKFCIGK